MVVNKPVGFVKVGDLPARDEIDDGIKKKIQFFDVLLEYEGAIDLNEVETMFLQQRYEDLPPPIKVPGNNVTPFTMQLVVLPLAEGKWNIVKHIRFADGAKVMHNTIKSMSVGRALEIDYQKNFKDGSRALQYLLEGMGGFQVRYQKLVPANSNTKLVRETEDIRKGFQYIRENGPQDNSTGQFTSWTEEEVNNPNGVLYRWDRGTVKEFLRCLADQGSQSNTISDWPLSLVDFKPWALNLIVTPLLPFVLEHAIIWIGKSEIGKSPLSYTMANLMFALWKIQENSPDDKPCFQTANHLDYFRKERGRRTKPRVFDDGNLNLEQPASVKAVTEVSGIDRKTMARYNASSYEKNQFCQACSNPYDRHQEPSMAPKVSSDEVSFDTFFKIVRPSFHKDFNEEDLIAVFKRSAVVVFTEIGIYVRPPSTKKEHVKRHAWPDKDCGMVSFCARPRYHAYLRGKLSANGADANHLQWSLNLLQAALDNEVVPSCTTIFGKSAFTGQKFIQENRPELAGIDAKTIFYPDKDTSSALERESKRFKSVKSSSNLLAPASSASSSAEHAKPEHEVQEYVQVGHDSLPSTANKEEASKKEDETVKFRGVCFVLI